jgi:hypothetical protein
VIPRRPRKYEDGRFLPKDAKLWRRLIKHARFVAASPFGDTSQLYKAAEACGRCVPPPGHAHRASAFLAIVLQGRSFGRLSDAERRIKAPELAGLAEQCDAALNAPPPAGAPGSRADIFG